jgi:hypothetical protein
MHATVYTSPSKTYLSQRFLGENWTHYIGCSRFSVYWRASRLNYLENHELRSALRIHPSAANHSFRRLNDPLPVGKLLDLSPDRAMRTDYWPLQFWWPFGGVIPRFLPWRLHLCPMCARYCYHSMLFQAPGIHRCPWHRAMLIDACPRCHRQLQERPFKGLPIGRCGCGLDWVNYVASIGGDQETSSAKRKAIADYGMAAATSRRNHFLVMPSGRDAYAWSALHALATPALWRTQQCHAQRNAFLGEVVLDNVWAEHPLPDDRSWLSPNSGLRAPKSSVLSLPLTWKDVFVNVGDELIHRVDAESMRRVAGTTEPGSPLRKLRTFAGSHALHLYTAPLQPPTRQVLRTLAVAMHPATTRSDMDTLASRARAHPLGHALLQLTIRRVLSRGYAVGARSLLGQHIPGLRSNRHTEPKYRHPWAVLCMPPGKPASAHIAWNHQREAS